MTIPVYYSSPGVGRFRIYWDNLADATATATTSSSASAEYPLENLANIWPTYAFRTASLGAPDYIKWDLGTAQFVSSFFLWGHNITAGATIRLQGNATDAWGAPAYDAPVTWNTKNLVHILTSAVSLRWWRIVITDPLNPDGYISAGYRFIGSYFEPACTYARRTPGFVDPSEIGFSRGGQLNASALTPYQVLAYEFDAASAADVAALWTIFQAVGNRQPFFLVEDSNYPLTTTRYVRAVGEWNFPPIVYGWNKFSLSVETMR